MKTVKKLFMCVIAVIISASVVSCGDGEYKFYHNLGAPLGDVYQLNERAKCPWDMIIYDGSLYIGGGDYGGNAGPVTVWQRSIADKSWSVSGSVPDEEINRFLVIDGELVITGTDPIDDWTLGNYYVMRDGEWSVKRVIPHAVHNFDMLSYNGQIFAAIGTEAGFFPVSVSDDGGESFSNVPFEKNGLIVNTSSYTKVRCYDLFLLGDNVYAAASFKRKNAKAVYEIYRYDSGKFVFFADWTDQVEARSFSSNVIGAKAYVGDKIFFTTGYLYCTEDMSTVTPVDLNANEAVYDIYTEGEEVYILTAENTVKGRFNISVKRYSEGSESFETVFYFNLDTPPISLAVCGNDYYVGVGHPSSNSELNGSILHIKYYE